jgi:ABC-type Fe2+-enterobactin transport system substrate-binding protein
MGLLGNTFEKKHVAYGHARKVWREVHDQYPAGGKIVNTSDFLTTKVVPAGSPVKYDMEKKEITVITQAQLAACVSGDTVTDSAAKALGINGYLYNDAPLTDENTYATGAVVYRGELYKYMLTNEAVKVIEATGVVPGVVLVM